MAEPAQYPMTSVAEFRAAAWPDVHQNLAGMVALDIYLTWCWLGGGLALVGFGVYGATEIPESWWLVLAGAVVLALVFRRLRRKFGDAAAVRARVDALSREVDARAAAGVIPVAPPGWTDPVPAAPPERRSSWM